jgi:hypothetical protein
MNRMFARFSVSLLAAAGLLLPLHAAPDNLARGCAVEYVTTPNYAYSAPASNTTALTDGVYTSGYFWTQKTTVGWYRAYPVQIILDLGADVPIAGVQFSTAAGTAGVEWPAIIHLLVSTDRTRWAPASELIGLSAATGTPPLGQYTIYRYATQALRTHGRYLQLVVYSQGPCVFCDEVEVYRGNDAWLAQPLAATADLPALLVALNTTWGVNRRLTADLAQARADAASLPGLTPVLNAIAADLAAFSFSYRDDFRAVLPLNDLHTRLYAAYAPLMAAKGYTSLFAWKGHRYDPLTPHQVPATPPSAVTLTYALLGNERRGDTFCLTNPTATPETVALRVVGLPGTPQPGWLFVSAMPWTDTGQGVPVAAALPPAAYQNGAYLISVPAGTTRKVWVCVDASKLAAGTYRGYLTLAGSRRMLAVPMSITVSRIALQRPRLSLGLWDYTTTLFGGTSAANREAIIDTMQAGGVDTPWAPLRTVLPWPAATAFDADGHLLAPLDFTALDAWLRRWPQARTYGIMVPAPTAFAGATAGTPAFTARLSTWAAAVAEHLTLVGVDPRRVRLEIIDEPSTDADATVIAAWTTALHTASPSLGVFENPAWAHPEALANQQALTTLDTLCPNLDTYLKGGTTLQQYYAARRQAGQTLWFYRCLGATRLLDPARYYRLAAWQAFRDGATGMQFWSMTDTGGTPSAWNEYRILNRHSFSPVYLDPQGITSALGWEAIRDGVQDYELLAMLADGIAAARSEFLRRQAATLLNVAVTAALAANPASTVWSSTIDRSAPDAYRPAIIAMLERLR